jgi:hypothetical protein
MIQQGQVFELTTADWWAQSSLATGAPVGTPSRANF